MDDLIQVLVYVAFLVIYLISKVLKNKKEKPVTRQPEAEVEQDFSDPHRPHQRPEVGQRQGKSGMDEPERKPSTFEEILRELTGAEQWEEQTRRHEKEERMSEFERRKEKARQRADEIEQEAAQKANRYSRRSDYTVEQARQEQRTRKNLREIEKLTEPVKRKKPYQKKNPMAREIVRSLKDPDSVKKAVILSEIINRKHF